MRTAILGSVIGIICGFIATALLAKFLAMQKMRKWCAKIENAQIDTEIRLDILEYNHLHEDGNPKIRQWDEDS